jgi:hypothetical protein
MRWVAWVGVVAVCVLGCGKGRDGSGSKGPVSAHLTVSMTGTGAGRVTSSPAGIDCPGSCTATIPAGSSMSLWAKADAGSNFAGWGGGCSGPGDCAVSVGGDVTVWANFESNKPPPPPAQCAGITPGPAPTSLSIAISTPATCSAGMGDGMSTLGLQALGSPRGVTLSIVDAATGRVKNTTGGNYQNWASGSFTPQPDGFTGVFRSQITPEVTSIHYWNHDGIYVQSGQTVQGKPPYAGMPLGGVLMAGDINSKHQVWLFGRGGTDLSWGKDLASKGAVFGLGGDAQNRAIVITDGGPGTITAQWFDSRGTALTGEFVILTNFQAGPNTWFETAPLIGSGVAVRRVDQQNDSSGRPYRTSQWLILVPGGQATAQAAPAWLGSKNNTQLAVTRSGRGYALLPLGGPDADCGQKIEVLVADGTSCGSFDASVASGRCRTEDMGLSQDDTPIQLLPGTLAQAGTCAYRWWKGALR